MSFYRNRFMSSGSIPQIDNDRRGGIPGRDQYTKLLLHCDGVDESSAFIDSSLTPKAVQAYGTTGNQPAAIDSAQSVFGGFSGRLNAGSRFLSTPDSSDWTFGTGDFTMECRIRWDNLPTGTAAAGIFSQYWGAADYWYTRLLSRAGAIISVTINAAGTGYAVNNTLTITQAGSSGGTLNVDSVDGAGAVTGVTINSIGTAYTVANALATTVSPAGGTGCKINITAVAAHALQFVCVGAVPAVNFQLGRGFAAVADTWYHYALIRYGNVFSHYIDGTLVVSSLTDVSAMEDYAAPFNIGQTGTIAAVVSSMDGWVDEVRVSVGVARWTTNFTPPAMAYI